MDQTQIPYSFHLNKIHELKVSKTIHVRTSAKDTNRVTLVATVDGSGNILPLLLIFEGATNGRITNCEFITYSDGGHYSCQKRVEWMRK
jgi:hypothetical protein